MTDAAHPDRKGLTLAVCAYALWGVLPLYFHLLRDVPALQVLAHRVVWSVLLLVVAVAVLGKTRAILAAARGRTLLLLLASAALVAVGLGILVLGERLRRVQGVAIGIATAGVLVMAVSGGGAIGVSLALAITFGLYGLLRKVATINALGGLTVETVLLTPLAAVWLLHSASLGTTGFGQSIGTDALILAAGVITATPLLMFAAAARRLPLSTLGLIQYLAPTLQFGIALMLGEPLRTVHLITFALIWAGCALYAWDSLRAARSSGQMVPD